MKNYITVRGLNRLKQELHSLLTIERPKVVEVVAWAASNGDRSENADYIYGKRRLREIDGRIRFLQGRIDSAESVEPTAQKGDRILFGATVTIEIEGEEGQEERTYAIVGSDEVDAKKGMISWNSPVGKALLGKKRGDQIEYLTPGGRLSAEIIDFVYTEIDPVEEV